MNDHEPTDTMKPGDRAFLLVLICAAWVLTLVFSVAAFIWPHGLLDVSGPVAAILLVLLFAVVGGLTITFSSMASSNPAIGPAARALWTASFVVAGPVAVPAYWLMHVWPTPPPRRKFA